MTGQNQTKEPTDYRRLVSTIAALLVGLLAAGAFTLSYAALWDMAITYGVPPRLAWIWPILIDFGLIVFSLDVVRVSLYGETPWKSWVMVALYTVATVAFNVLHAPDNLTARVIAVVAPMTLFLTFETLMGMVRDGVKRATVNLVKVQPEAVKVEPETVKPVAVEVQPVTLPEPEPAPVKASPELSPGIEERRERVLTMLGQEKTQAEIAQALGVGLSTIKRDIKELNGRVKA